MASNFTNNVISAINIKDVKYNIKAVPFHATEAEWNGMSYIPKQGEFIVYDVDSNNTFPRFKTGDGVTDVKNLPFTLATISEVQAYVNSQIGSAGHLKRIVLEDGAELPDISKAEVDTIYMKKNSESRLISDVFDEYMVINGAWEIIGNTRVDLSDYTTQEMVDEKIETAISNIDFPEEIYINDEAPENPKENALWLDTDEEAAVSGGSASIDVTAEVGQTIVVEEVDANGKPTKWKAAEYQPRTHGKEIAELLPNTQASFVEEEGMFTVECDFTFTVGNTYTINWNGTPYTCVAFDVNGAAVGNGEALSGTGDSGEPFFVGVIDGMLFAVPLDGSAELVIGVSGEIYRTIDKTYLPNDVVYGYPKYSYSAFDIEQYCWIEAGLSNVFGVTSDFENTELTRKHFEVLEDVFENQMVYIPSTNAFVRAYQGEYGWELQFVEFSLTRGSVVVRSITAMFRWSDTDNCVQRYVRVAYTNRLQVISES